MIRIAAVTAAMAVAVLSAGAASASDYRVGFGDLDLATSEGAARFDRRVGRAARAACQTGSPLLEVRCRARFRSEAMRLLPDGRREDYARARGDRIVVRTPTDQG
ncbi:UrcA family protein [Brevundimonas sp.]|uniref:UrcA family protein n=1 Tax=Brevundimonas sp. TaxID=1871086 RepID=UPI00262C8E03|nr:UrcA family protein [Brevundimonas sp.]